MNTFKAVGQLLAVAVAGSQLIACGNGGSSSNSGEYATVNEKTPAVQASAVSITPENANVVASSALKSVLLSDMSASAIGNAVNVSQQQNTQIANMATGVVISLRPVNCLNHGSFTLQASLESTGENIQVNMADNLNMTFNTQFNDCNQGSATLDGKLDINFIAVINELIESNNITIDSTIGIEQLTVTQAGYNPFVVNGAVNYKVSSPDGALMITEVNATDMYYAADNSYQVIEFDSYKAVDLPSAAYEYNFYGRFVDFEVENSLIEYQTLEPLTGVGFTVPSGGSIAVYGAQSTQYIDVIDNQYVELSMDYNNDGVIDEIITSTWQELALNYL